MPTTEFENRVLESLGGLQTQTAVLATQHIEFSHRLAAIEKVLAGNGRPSLTERVATIEERTSPVKAAAAGGGAGAILVTVISAVLRQMGI